MRRRLDRMILAVFLLVILPYMVTVWINGRSVRTNVDHSPMYVKVQTGNTIKKVRWEEYFIGTLAKEIDVTYGEEALKAQAVLTRTNLYRKIAEKKDVILPGEYMTYAEMKKLWGEYEAEKIYRRLQNVSQATENQALLYKGNPASASFHQLSGGKTRNGSEALGGDYPYLTIRECPKDIESELQLQTLTLSYDEVKAYFMPYFAAAEKKEADRKLTFADFEIKSTDEAGYVTKIRIGEHVYSGEEFRNALGLPSSCFTLQEMEGKLKITTKGVGHGLGMSQYTANEMAKEGRTYGEILEYFFEGTEIRVVAEILLNIE